MALSKWTYMSKEKNLGGYVMKKLLVLFLSVFLAAGAALAGDIPVPSSPLRYSLASGSSGGNFYVVGGGIATLLNNKLPKYFTITSECF